MILIWEGKMVQQDSGNTGNQGGQGQDNWRDQHKEWRHHDPLRGLFWGLLLILLGCLFFVTMQGWLSWDTWWQYFLIGLGLIFLIDALAHYMNPATRFGTFGKIIPGIILIAVGSAFIFGMEEWWPLILIVVGVIILLRFIFRKR
jgi:uncharacterized membrane protein YjjP (DUF1212 family)